MAIWDRLKDGIDKANKVAQDALDEGKTRMDARRARQAADKAAEALGYASFRAWEQGRELEADTLDRLARALRDHEQEAVRLERSLDEAAEWRRRQGSTHDGSAAGGSSPAEAASSAPGDASSSDAASPPSASGSDSSPPPVG